jgi:hypothetical protein
MPLAGPALFAVFSPSRLKVPDVERFAALPAAGAEVPLVPKIRMAGVGPIRHLLCRLGMVNAALTGRQNLPRTADFDDLGLRPVCASRKIIHCFH